jgi:Protein of unknown function (DUF3025)
VTAALDWRQPWLAPLTDVSAQPALVRFVAASALPEGEAYEAFIARTGCVPTRDHNLHDHFNRLIWHRHPSIKQRLNALQAAEIAARGIGATRGALRDALTLFDENGALWPDAPPQLARALAARDWHALFVTHRALWRDRGFEVFGHALLEQLATAPRKALTAHVLLAHPMTLTPAQWAAKPFLPLPVLGIPGWWPANEDPEFYEDKQVFRPAPLKGKTKP